MALPIIPIAVGTVMICRKVQKVAKVSDTIRRVWPTLSGVATKSINAIARVLNRMSVLLGEQSSSSSIWAAARTAVEESVRVNPQFVTQVLGSGMSKETAINFFAKLFELLI
ncbi:MAG: hypothetical protein NC343_07200 [Muribaculum sp.]|nr:hypothetical protein [Muribaculum sp.]MCM1142765.1 hypothetical protein [Muribaculum sp.]